MQRCPYCARPNQPLSSFCIHCGEPTDAESVLEYARDRGFAAPNAPPGSISFAVPPGERSLLGKLFSPERGLEFVVGLVILLGILGFALYVSIEQNAQYEHYKRAQEAEQRKDYELALAEYSAAGNYRDTSLRSSMVRDRIAERDKAYTIGIEYRKERKWWQAARALLEVEEIQPNFRDTRRQLADVRRVNGVVFYKQVGRHEGGTTPGIFVAYADGGDPVALPLTNQDSTVLAVSPDSRWVAYDVNTGYEPAIPRAQYLYDVASRAAYPLHLPVGFFPDLITARFTPDSQKLWLSANQTSFSYALPAPGSGVRALLPGSTPTAQSSRRMEHEIVVRSVTLRSAENIAAGNEVLVISRSAPPPSSAPLSSEAGPDATRHVATERGIVDGAVFSGNGDLLLYRVCGQLDREGSYVCRLRLVDLTLQALYPNTIATIAVRGRDMQDWALTGGFTRDGRHVLLIQRLREETTVRLYTPNSGDTWMLADRDSPALAEALTGDALLPLGVPGLAHWTGKNALTYTQGAMLLQEARAEWPQRYFASGPWVAASPSDRYLLYLDRNESPPILRGPEIITTMSYGLYSTPFRSRLPGQQGEATHRLLTTFLSPTMWISSIYMLPEGRMLLSAQPPQPGDSAGLYAYDLGTGEHIMAVPGATHLWGPGYYTLQPQVPVFAP